MGGGPFLALATPEELVSLDELFKYWFTILTSNRRQLLARCPGSLQLKQTLISLEELEEPDLLDCCCMSMLTAA